MTDNTTLQHGSVFEVTQTSCSNTEKEKCLEQLSAENHAELETILSKLTLENPVSDTLFMEKFIMLILEDFIPWQKPLGELFENSIVFCQAKPRKFSDQSSCRGEIFSDDGGLPLPMQFNNIYYGTHKRSRSYSLIKELYEKYHLFPLSEKTGRQILSICNKIDSESYQNLPIIAVCHGEDPKSAVLLGSLDQYKTRLVVKTEGSLINDPQAPEHQQLPRLATFKETHLYGFPPSFTDIDTSVYAHYEFLDCEKKENALTPVKGSCITMECWWSDAFALLEPLTPTSTAYAKVQAVTGDNMTGAFSLYREFQFIEALQKCLQTGLMTWDPACDSDVMKRVKEFINEQKTTVHKREKPAPGISNPEYFDDKSVLENRPNLDFTEKLWTILKDCSSYEELQDSFTFVYNALREFSMPPYVYQKNMSTLAIDIKRMMEKPVTRQAMTPKLAIQLLLEIGVEKMRRDYVTLFVKIIPLENISWYLEPELLSLDAVTCLKKLHSVLELTIVCVKRLNLSNILLSEFVRSTLKHYTTVPDIDLSHIFSFQIPAVKARKILNPMRPTVWEISFVSRMEDFMKQSIHRFITTPTQEHIYAPDNFHPGRMLKTALMVYLTATLVQSDVF